MNEAPPVTNFDLALLETILEENGDWMFAKDIAVSWRWQEKFPHLEGSRSAWMTKQERKIRAIASASHGSVLSWPGSPGYRLRAQASEKEVQTAIAKLKHQGGEMMARANAIAAFGLKETSEPKAYGELFPYVA